MEETPWWKRKWVIIAGVVLGLACIGGIIEAVEGDEPEQAEAAAEPVPEPEPEETEEPEPEPEPEPEGWADDDMEYLLAVIDAGYSLPLDDPSIDEYADALDAAELKCEENRTEIGDMAALALNRIQDAGRSDESAMSVLAGLENSIPEEMAPRNCADQLAAMLVVMGV